LCARGGSYPLTRGPECFLQFKKPNSQKQVTCPFCNSVNYAVKYTGSLTKEERSLLEQVAAPPQPATLNPKHKTLNTEPYRKSEISRCRAPPPATSLRMLAPLLVRAVFRLSLPGRAARLPQTRRSGAVRPSS